MSRTRRCQPNPPSPHNRAQPDGPGPLFALARQELRLFAEPSARCRMSSQFDRGRSSLQNATGMLSCDGDLPEQREPEDWIAPIDLLVIELFDVEERAAELGPGGAFRHAAAPGAGPGISDYRTLFHSAPRRLRQLQDHIEVRGDAEESVAKLRKRRLVLLYSRPSAALTRGARHRQPSKQVQPR